MTPPLGASFYADRARLQTVRVLENVAIARDTFRVRFACPELARSIVPGQFIMLKLAGCDDPLLGRPLAFYDRVLDAAGEPSGLDVVYLVVGKLTSRLARSLPGQEIQIWGPLGNGFAPTTAEHLIMVAGGIGQTPFLALAQEYSGRQQFAQRSVAPAQRITLCYGARKKEYLAGVEDFQRLGIEVALSTDDGSAGHHGLVTHLLQRTLVDASLGSTRVVACGPERMLEAVAEICSDAGVACEVSLETPMACGIGICFSCVTRVRDASGEWDYRRTCVEGPVFDAAQIAW
ncbi:MAG TPA: dihydroorotate dehydrogenase electron transfer subunit [Pirellulales bacterium]|jgi:dihydroorotate dehydrogenase electron transfer subunit|nr:dihydroorotate dehydrogenase electron transfer subunit [Pirellulales bacterium]